MRALPVGAVFSSELLWWELLLDTSQCWGNRLKKSFLDSCNSVLGPTRHDAGLCRHAQAISSAVRFVDNGENAAENISRVSDGTLSATSERFKKLYLEPHKGLRNACGYIRAIIQEGSIKAGGKLNVFASTTSDDLYFRSAAKEGLKPSPFCKWVFWDAMLAGQAGLGNGFLAVELFEKMQQGGVHLNKVTLLSMLKACSDAQHVGRDTVVCGMGQNAAGYDLEEGQHVVTEKALKSSTKHFMYRASLSGSPRSLKETRGIGRSLSSIMFGRAMSTSTEKQCDEDPGEQQSSIQHSSSQQQSSLEIPQSTPEGGPSWPNPDNAASYVLMSNIYADGDRWDEVKRINEMRLKARAWKKPGKAYVEIKAKVHEFIVGDRTHQDSTNIYEKLRKIKRHMGHIGYVPNLDLVLENRSHYDPYKPK